MQSASEVTQLLLSVQAGDRSALDRLTPVLYDELRRLARSLFRRERSDHTIQPTALVHEAWLRLVDQGEAGARTRSEFLQIAARVMRQVLVDHARQHRAAKRGGGAPRVDFDEKIHLAPAPAAGILALHEAIEELALLDRRKAHMIELKYFGGLTGEEIAAVCAVSTATVARELRMAQAWLSSRLKARAAQS